VKPGLSSTFKTKVAYTLKHGINTDTSLYSLANEYCINVKWYLFQRISYNLVSKIHGIGKVCIYIVMQL